MHMTLSGHCLIEACKGMAAQVQASQIGKIQSLSRLAAFLSFHHGLSCNKLCRYCLSWIGSGLIQWASSQ